MLKHTIIFRIIEIKKRVWKNSKPHPLGHDPNAVLTVCNPGTYEKQTIRN